MVLLILIPWVLTVVALLLIMFKGKKNNDDEVDFPMDDDHEVIRVAVQDEKAYWVYDNVFYEADTMREPDFTTARPIDTMTLSPKELNHLLSILDDLKQDQDNERD